MAAFAKILLSGSVNGAPISITGDGPSNATLLHTAVTGTGDFHEIYVDVVNTVTTASEFTLVWGITVAGATTAGVTEKRIAMSLPPHSGPIRVAPGWPLNGALIVEGYATAAARVQAYGYAHTRVS